MKEGAPGHHAEIELRVPFHDVDSTGIVWHGRYVKYFEIARCALLDSVNYGYQEMADSGYNWPVVDMRLRYYHALRFDQRVRVRAVLTEWEYRLRIRYLIADAGNGQRLTTGRTDQVAVEIATQRMCLPCPAILRERLECAR